MYLGLKDTVIPGYDGVMRRAVEDIYKAEFKDRLEEAGLAYHYELIDAQAAELKASRFVPIVASKVLLALLIFWHAYRSEDAVKAALAGLALLYVVLTPGCYYWSVLAFLPLMGGDRIEDVRRLTIAAVAANVAILSERIVK